MILVTGATGLVGGHLIWHLLQKNERIAAIKRTTSNLEPLKTIFRFYNANPEELLSRIDWRIADVLNAESLTAAMHDVKIMYHCAAVVSLGSGSDVLTDTNVRGTRNVVQACLSAKIKKLCFVSSIAACGKYKDEKPADENAEWTDDVSRSAYSRSKYFSEQEVWKGIRSGLNAVIVNPGVILGVSGQNAGSSQLFYQMQKGLMFYTMGGTGYVDVQDVVRAMITLTESEISGERFVLVGENASNRDILWHMADGFGRKRPFINVPKSVLMFAGSIMEVLGKIFGFQPLIDRGTARSATHREFYSSSKIEKAIDFKFTSMVETISGVCGFMSRK
jgi:nucleoside-diphosphate-sugar epimerase